MYGRVELKPGEWIEVTDENKARWRSEYEGMLQSYGRMVAAAKDASRNFAERSSTEAERSHQYYAIWDRYERLLEWQAVLDASGPKVPFMPQNPLELGIPDLKARVSGRIIPSPDLPIVELGREFKINNHPYRLVEVLPGLIRAYDQSPPYSRTPRVVERTWKDVRAFENETGMTVPAKLLEPLDKEDLKLAIRQMLLDYIGENPGTERGDLPDLFRFRPIPGYSIMDIPVLKNRIGMEELKGVVDEVWDTTHKPQPPIATPITIQPDGVHDAINQLYTIFTAGRNDDVTFATPRQFEEYMQQAMGLDMNDPDNLNIAYDSLEGAFNLLARDIRADLDARNAPLHERIAAMAGLEARLLRARRTVSKMSLQQFSTPLSISEAAGFAADVRPGDVIVEPTAGTANLVDRFFGRGDVTIEVNEFGAGRRRVLSGIGYNPTGLDVMKSEWVIGPDGKRLPPLGNVVIANPPWGAYTTGKYGRPVNIPVKMNDWSQRFTHLILERMPENGRFVGVMPTNWIYTLDRSTRELSIQRSTYLKWIEQHYNVRAIVESPPDAYKQRGTNIGSLLVVIDKGPKPEGALPAIEAWGEHAPKSWDEYSKLVEQLGKGGTHERPEYDIRTSQSSVSRYRDDEINARRPATGPDAAGLADPNARAGKPEADPANIGKPVVEQPEPKPAAATSRNGDAGEPGAIKSTRPAKPIQPSLGDTPHPAGSIRDLLGSRGAVLPNGKNRLGPNGEIITEPTGRPVVSGTHPEGGVGERGNSPAVRGTAGDRNSGQQPGRTNDAGQLPGAAGDHPAGLVEGQPGELQPGVSEPVSAQQPAGEPQPRVSSGAEGAASGALPDNGPAAGRIDDAQYQQQWKEQVSAVERAGAFTGYVGRSAGALGEEIHHHPSLVVETKALSSVVYSDLEEAYKPTAGVMAAYQRGDLSIEGQMDPIWATIQQNDKNHMGILIADDVGMGKSRSAAGFALDRVERGQKRILVITKNQDNINNLMEGEFPLIFGDTLSSGKVRFQKVVGEAMPEVKKGNEPIPTYAEPTVYFMPASQFSDFAKAIKDLDVQTVIVDEAHTFKNVDESGYGGHWNDLHKEWTRKNVSFMYLTATPATDIAEMKYLYGLKLGPWTVLGIGLA